MTDKISDLREVSLSRIHDLKTLPSPKIKTDRDVETWRTTQSYADYSIFLRRLSNAVIGKFLPWSSGPDDTGLSEGITKMIQLLDTLNSWIDDIQPLESPQRFGNLAFRSWGARLEERMDEVLNSLLSPHFADVASYVRPLLATSFGSFTRMDYGTGHETSFALFLLVLSLVRFFNPIPSEERALVLLVFVRYLRLCWRLQDTYRLEPAGSHGVWGLDDYCFLGYIFGSAQVLETTNIPVNAVLQPSLPPTNLYFMLIERIRQVKIGPFHEHSAQLHSIAVGVPNWKKVNTGLFKMYEAEVLGKRVVMQHVPLGGVLEWDSSSVQTSNISATNRPIHLLHPCKGARSRNLIAAYYLSMEVVDPRSALLSNYEVLSLLRELEHRHLSKARTAARVKKEDETAKNGPHETVSGEASENLRTVEIEAIQYLSANYLPTRRQTPEGIVDLTKKLLPYELTKAEKLQVVNLAPTLPVELYVIVEELEDRLGERTDEILTLVGSSLSAIAQTDVVTSVQERSNVEASEDHIVGEGLSEEPEPFYEGDMLDDTGEGAGIEGDLEIEED